MIRPFARKYYLQPDAIANLQGKFCKHTQDFWYFEDQSRKPLLLQPGQGNVVIFQKSRSFE